MFALNQRGLNAVKDRSHLNIGWNRCPVFDYLFLPRCAKCAEHGHTAIACDGPVHCIKCGREGHRKEDCRNEEYCIACARERTTEDRGHSMMAWDCPIYLEKLATEKRRIVARLN